MFGLRNICSVLILCILGVSDAIGQGTFKEVAIEWGVEHYHHNLNYIGVGGGVAIFDYNNDGYQDLYFTGGNFQDELFKNNGNRSFTPVGLYAGIGITKYYNTKSVTTGDINNDGYRDLFLSTEGGLRNLLFLNNGDGTFTEIGGQYDDFWSTGGVFGDFNLDGYLDLYVIRYIESGKAIVDEESNVIGFDQTCYANNLYLNNGDLTFAKQDSSGTEDEGCGLAVVATDIDNDYIPDIYIANDFGEWVLPNGCYINNYPEATFNNESEALNLDARVYGMGIAVGDYNQDGLLDYYVTNIGSNKLFENQGNGSFTDVANSSDVQNTYANDKFTSSWGTAFFDYDHDGYEDLFVANGFLQAAPIIGNALEQPNVLYRNLGNGMFEDVTMLETISDSNIAKGMAVGDLDNDGDLEVIVTAAGDNELTGNVLIYENQSESANHWLQVLLSGTYSNRDGIGATVKAYSNGAIWIHEVEGGSSHASQNSTIAHFGLGEVTVLDSLVVTWPGGKHQKFEMVDTDHLIYIEEDASSFYIAGCTDQTATNYDPTAEFNYGCFHEVPGCLDQEAINFDVNANVESGDCIYEQIEVPLGIDDDKEPGIFPNPIMHEATIQLSNRDGIEFRVRLFSITGKMIFSKVSRNSTFKFQRGDLPSGIYLLNISGPDHNKSIRLVIK